TEADLLVAADRRGIVGGRIDREPVMSALLDQIPSHRPDGVGPDPLVVTLGREEEVDAGAPVLGSGLLRRADRADHLTLHVDRESGIQAEEVAADVGLQISATRPSPPRGHCRLPEDRNEATHVLLAHRAEHHVFAAQDHAPDVPTETLAASVTTLRTSCERPPPRIPTPLP